MFFDAGETLVHPYPSFPELLSTVLAGEGHDVSPERIREHLPAVANRFTRAAQQGEQWSTSTERSRAFWSDIYQVLLGELGIPLADALGERLYTTFTDVANYRLFPDALPVLEKLRGAGLGLGLISNFEAWLEQLLVHLEVDTFFDVRIVSGIERVEKPDPAIFRLALSRMNAYPASSVYVGDSVEFDVEPARAVGMTPVLVDRRGRYPDHEGIRILSLDELPAILGL